MAYVEVRNDTGLHVSGFVYTDNNRTRLLFAPRFTVTREDADREVGDLVLCAAANWPPPRLGEMNNALDALHKQFPDRRIYADAAGGLVLMVEPKGAK